MPFLTPEPPEVCSQCGYAHIYRDNQGERGERRAWVMEQHAVPRYRRVELDSLFTHGDVVLDRDGDGSILWHNKWVHDPYLKADWDNDGVCRFVMNMDSLWADRSIDSAGNYEPYGLWHKHIPLRDVPTFTSLEEAEAWLEANS